MSLERIQDDEVTFNSQQAIEQLKPRILQRAHGDVASAAPQPTQPTPKTSTILKRGTTRVLGALSSTPTTSHRLPWMHRFSRQGKRLSAMGNAGRLSIHMGSDRPAAAFDRELAGESLPTFLRRLVAGYEYRIYWYELFECFRKVEHPLRVHPLTDHFHSSPLTDY